MDTHDTQQRGGGERVERFFGLGGHRVQRQRRAQPEFKPRLFALGKLNAILAEGLFNGSADVLGDGGGGDLDSKLGGREGQCDGNKQGCEKYL